MYMQSIVFFFTPSYLCFFFLFSFSFSFFFYFYFYLFFFFFPCLALLSIHPESNIRSPLRLLITSLSLLRLSFSSFLFLLHPSHLFSYPGHQIFGIVSIIRLECEKRSHQLSTWLPRSPTSCTSWLTRWPLPFWPSMTRILPLRPPT